MHETDKKLVQEVAGLLDESVERIDMATLTKLNRARHHALEQGARGVRVRLWYTPAATIAVLALAVATWFLIPFSDNTLDTDEQAAYIAVTASWTEEDMELIEALDFYVWLLEEERES